MNFYPAIDILEGKAVRLRQGRRTESTVYGTPSEMARRWVGAGARWLHIVDLDGAFEGRPRNGEAIAQIRSECADVRMQVGGGIRDMAAIDELLGNGAERVVLGTAAVENPDLLAQALDSYPGRIAVGVDAHDGKARLSGWTASTSLTALDLALRMEQAGVGLIIYTDISRDGELLGVNVEATRRMLELTGLDVIASGGVSSVDDIKRLKDLGHGRLDGVIIGKALYEGRIRLEEVLADVS